MFVVDLNASYDPKREIARVLDAHAKSAKRARKAIEKHDVEKEIAAWSARTAKAMKRVPPGDQFGHLCFVIVNCPIASDQEGYYTELLVGSDTEGDPLVDDIASYAEYDASELKEGYLVHHVPFLTTVARELEELDVTELLQGELELAFAGMAVDRLCRAEPALLLGGRESRRIFLGWNEATDLLGVVTKEGWKPKPLEAEAKAWVGEMGG